MIHLSGRTLLGLAIALTALHAQETTFEGAPALTLGNDKLRVLILKQGTAIGSIILNDDPAKMNPLWDPLRMAREEGGKGDLAWGTGHFLCLDAFGATSTEERAAGLPFHGEAHLKTWDVKYDNKQGATHAITLATEMPIVQEKVQRTFRLVDGEQVMYVETQIESLLGFDRPVIWAEHATVGSPFLEPGVTVIDVSAKKSLTRTYSGPNGAGAPLRFQQGKEFTWPFAPGADGKKLDMRLTPEHPNSGGHVTMQMDRTRKLAYLTMFNPKMGLLVGYLFRVEDFPWVQSWENFPKSGKLARGMEFATQPFDVPRREAIQQNRMFDSPTYRWLPARSTIESRFLMFYTRVGANFKKVDDVRLEGSSIVIEDKSAKQKIVLAASLGM